MPNPGYVYVLANSAMPDYVKVGRTKLAPEERARTLSSSTGVPMRYIVIYEAFTEDNVEAEKVLHKTFEEAGFRLSPSREHFAIAPKQAVLLASTVMEDLFSHLAARYIERNSREYQDATEALETTPIGSWANDPDVPLPYSYKIGAAFNLPKIAVSQKPDVIIDIVRALGQDNNPDACYLMGLYQRYISESEECAISHLKRGAANGNVFCYAELVWAFRFTDKHEDAFETFKSFLRHFDDSRPDRALGYAYIYEFVEHYFDDIDTDHDRISTALEREYGVSYKRRAPQFLAGLHEHFDELRPYRDILLRQARAQSLRDPENRWLLRLHKYIDFYI